MKTNKILMLLGLFGLINSVLVKAQPENKDFYETTSPYSGYAFCGTESVTGTVTNQWKITVPGQIFQRKIFYSLIGEETGCHYEAQAVINVNYKIPSSGVEKETLTRHFFVRKDNLPLGFIRETFHFTVNANGELTVWFDNFSVECFELR